MMAVASFMFLLFAVIGLVRFGVDVWRYYQACGCSAANPSSVNLNYGGLYPVVVFFVLSVLFFLLFLCFSKTGGKR